jgi:hypothetical protein
VTPPRYPPYAGRLLVSGMVIGSGFCVSARGVVATCWHLVKKPVEDGLPMMFETLDRRHRYLVESRGEMNSAQDVALLWPKLPLESELPAAKLVSAAAFRPHDRFTLTGAGKLGDAKPDVVILSAIGEFVGPAEPYGVDKLELSSDKITRGMSGAAVHVAVLDGITGINTGRYIPGREVQEGPYNTVWATAIDYVWQLATSELDLVRPDPADPRDEIPPDGWLDAHELGELRVLLEAVSSPVTAAELIPLIWAAADDLGTVTPDFAAQPIEVVESLIRQWCQPGSLPPALVYTDLIARAISTRPGASSHVPRAATALRKWVEDQAGNLGVPQDEVERVRSRVARRISDPAEVYVSLRIDEDAIRAHRFKLTSWLYQDGAGLPFKLADEGAWVKDELREQSENLLDLLTPLTIALSDVPAHEFYLPLSLLGTKVDEWETGGAPGQRRPLGTYCPVVVRLTGRRDLGLAFNRWRDKWEQLMSHAATESVAWIHGPDCCAVHPEAANEFDWGGLDHNRLIARFAERDDLVCVALAFPYGSDDTETPAGIRAALNDGMPALLWSRNGADIAPLRELLAKLSSNGKLHSLPKQAFGLRKKVEGGNGEPLRFTLVWDDPNRHPEPASVFAAPARRTP